MAFGISTIFKKKVAEEKVAELFVNIVFNSVDASFSEVAELLNNDLNLVSKANVNPDDQDEFLMIVITGNYLLLDDYFFEGQEERIRELTLVKLAAIYGIEVSAVKSAIDNTNALFKKYPAMEDFQLDLVVGQGPSARTVKLALKRFTLVGATTRPGLLTSPLRDRFGSIFRLDYYQVADLEQIVRRSAAIMHMTIDASGTNEIARRSRGTPRIANRLLRRVRDFAQVKNEAVVTQSVARRALALLEVDEAGFDKMDRAILSSIIEKFNGGPVGVETIAASVGEEKSTIEDVYEPYLIQEGYLQRTARGRVATVQAYRHLGISRPGGGEQSELF